MPSHQNSQVVVELKGLADRYEKAVVEEDKLTAGPSSPPPPLHHNWNRFGL